MVQNLSLIAAGLVAGVLSGLFGIGGGIILVPFLVYALGLSQHTASGTSLVALLLPVGILGVLQYYRSGIITSDNIKMGLLLALGLFVGAFFGSKISIGISEEMLRRGFSILLIVAAIKMWFS